MHNAEWPEDPACFIYSPDEHGVSIIKFDQEAERPTPYKDGCRLYYYGKQSNSGLRGYRVYHSKNFLIPPKCRIMSTRTNSSDILVNIHNTRNDYELPRQPNLHILLWCLSIIVPILLLVICIMTGYIGNLRSKVQTLRQEREELRQEVELKSGITNELIDNLKQNQMKVLEVGMQSLILHVTQLKQSEPYNPEWQSQLDRARVIITRWRDSCGLSTIIPVRTKPATLPRPLQSRPKSILKHIKFDKDDSPSIDVNGEDSFLHALPDPNIIVRHHNG